MLKFNNKNLPDFVRVKKITIQTLPTVSTNLKNVAGGFGVISGKSTFAEKKIVADVSIVIPKGQTLQSCARVLAGWLKGDNFKVSPLILLDDASVQYMAKVSSNVSLSDLIFAGEGSIEFVVPSGLAESVTSKTATGTNTVSFTNSGTHTILPEVQVTINTAVNNGTVLITHTQTGDKITLTGTFRAGDKVIINNTKHLVKVNGNVSMNMIGLNTKFFEIAEGEHSISCSVNSNLKVIFQERWI